MPPPPLVHAWKVPGATPRWTCTERSLSPLRCAGLLLAAGHEGVCPVLAGGLLPDGSCGCLGVACDAAAAGGVSLMMTMHRITTHLCLSVILRPQCSRPCLARNEHAVGAKCQLCSAFMSAAVGRMLAMCAPWHERC
jgi:hypothetical protein